MFVNHVLTDSSAVVFLHIILLQILRTVPFTPEFLNVS